jgi:predicted transposase/invertase (TIGR01784 family)
MLTDVLEIHFLDMVKFRRLREKDIEHNKLHRWLTFFDKNASDKTIQKIIEMDTSIEKAHKKIMTVSQDSEMLRLYEMREMAMLDFNSSVNAATRKGLAMGEKKGLQKAQVNFVLKLSGKNKSAEEIAELTDLSVEEVNKILGNN